METIIFETCFPRQLSFNIRHVIRRSTFIKTISNCGGWVSKSWKTLISSILLQNLFFNLHMVWFSPRWWQLILTNQNLWPSSLVRTTFNLFIFVRVGFSLFLKLVLLSCHKTRAFRNHYLVWVAVIKQKGVACCIFAMIKIDVNFWLVYLKFWRWFLGGMNLICLFHGLYLENSCTFVNLAHLRSVSLSLGFKFTAHRLSFAIVCF